MADTNKQEAAAAAAVASAHQELHGTDISKVLKSKGPVVKCVLLKHMRADGKDGKPHAAPSGKVDDHHKRQVLTELIDEIEVDTTPSKSGVRNILGPFTFLGQYPSEKVVVMARKELPTDLSKESISSLRRLCEENEVDTSGMLEKNELVAALLEAQLPVNPHQLQPPLDGVVVRGDILIMKIAETDEVLDDDDDDDGKNGDEKKELAVMSNEEFFLNYTKEEWVAFASRTDVKAPEPPEDDDDEDDEEEEEGEEEANDGEDEDDEDDDEDDGAFKLGEDDMTEEEDKHAMLNLILGEVLRGFREQNGRGPDTRELLELRSQIAKELGVEVANLEALGGGDDDNDDDSKDKKRSAEEEALAQHASPKKVKFSQEAEAAAAASAEKKAKAKDDDDDEKKPAAKEEPKDGEAQPEGDAKPATKDADTNTTSKGKSGEES